MSKGANQKLKLTYLMQIMLEKTDSNHSLTMSEIIEELAKVSIGAERKAIYEDLEDLSRFGIDIDYYDEGRVRHYFVAKREFELAELKIMVDALQSSRFLPESKTKQLIKKVEGLASNYEAASLQRQVYVQGRPKTMNQSIYYSIDTLHNAIYENRMISFKYWNWNTLKKMEYRHDGKVYEVSPWALLCADENYYLVAYEGDEKTGSIKHFRVDKLAAITILPSERMGRKVFKDFDIAEYSKKSFGMFDGPVTSVRLLISNDMAGVIIDRFGTDVTFIPMDSTHSTVSITVALSSQFFGWLFALGSKVRIIGPEEVITRVRDYIDDISDRYR